MQELPHGDRWIIFAGSGRRGDVSNPPHFLRITSTVHGITNHDHRPNHDFRRPRQGGCGRRLA